MSRYSILAPIALLIAGTVFFPALSHAQSACSPELQVAASASQVADVQDAVGNAAAALASDVEARAEIVNATATCESVLTGDDLALFQEYMSLANLYVSQAVIENQANQTVQARLYELQLVANLDQAIELVAGR